MQEDRKKLYKQVMRYSAVGLEMGFCVAIGVLIGYYLDRYFHTAPWLTLIFLLLGVVAAFRSLFSLMKDIDKSERRN
jgi:ATP synthase protein I